MKKIKLSFIFILTSILFFGCGETVEESETKTVDREIINNDIEEDIVEDEFDNTLEAEIQPLFKKESITFKLDSNYTSKLTLSYSDEKKKASNELFYDDIKTLSTVLTDIEDIGYGAWPISSFLEIDSLKSNGKYKKFVENGDIGMVLYARAYAISYLNIDENTNLYIWAISYSTYEACPFSSGIYCYATTFFNSRLIETILIAENTAGGDPPSMGSTYTQATFKNDNKITLNKTDIFEDIEDETYNETNNKTIEMKIENGKFKTISVK